MTDELTPGPLTMLRYRGGSVITGAASRGCVVDRYRIMIVVDVLDGSTPAHLLDCVRRRHGDVVSAEVLDEHPGDETRRAAESPEHGPPGLWMDA